RRAEDAAKCGKKRAFRQQLANEPSARGAQGSAQRDFALPGGCPREQEVGYVGAGNQQEHAHRTEENPEDFAESAAERFPERKQARAPLVGKAAASRCLRSEIMGRRSASACASVTPGFKRPSKWT